MSKQDLLKTSLEDKTGASRLNFAVVNNQFQILDKLEKSVIIDEVLPLLTDIKLSDVNILVTVLGNLTMKS